MRTVIIALLAMLAGCSAQSAPATPAQPTMTAPTSTSAPTPAAQVGTDVQLEVASAEQRPAAEQLRDALLAQLGPSDRAAPRLRQLIVEQQGDLLVLLVEWSLKAGDDQAQAGRQDASAIVAAAMQSGIPFDRLILSGWHAAPGAAEAEVLSLPYRRSVIGFYDWSAFNPEVYELADQATIGEEFR